MEKASLCVETMPNAAWEVVAMPTFWTKDLMAVHGGIDHFLKI